MKNQLKNILKKLTSNKYISNIIDKIIMRQFFYERTSRLAPVIRPLEDNKFFDFSNINEEILNQLFEKTSFYWRQSGTIKEEIYYSVLTEEKYRKNMSEVEIKNFLTTGKNQILESLNYVTKFSKNDKKINSVLDFGCGVGRLSYNLPLSIPEIWCCDFSKMHLKEAKSNLSKRFIDTNLNFKYLSGINCIRELPKQDLIFSFITLQHNTPPIINYIIKQLLQLLNKDGIAVLHIPIVILNYQFNFAQYFNSKTSGKELEMHMLPKANLYQCAIECNCDLVFSECKGGCGGDIYSEYIVFRKN